MACPGADREGVEPAKVGPAPTSNCAANGCGLDVENSTTTGKVVWNVENRATMSLCFRHVRCGRGRFIRKCSMPGLRVRECAPDCPARIRSDRLAQAPGRFSFDGYVRSGWKLELAKDEMIVTLDVGDRFPRAGGHACWWAEIDGTGWKKNRQAADC